MILQILADAGEIEFDVDTLSSKFGGGTDAGSKQQDRRVDRTAGQDQFTPRADALDDPPVAFDLDTDGAAAFEQKPAHMGFGHQFEITPVEVRLEIASGGRTAPAIVDVERRETDTVDALAVESRVALILQPLAGFDECLRNRAWPLALRDRHWSAGAAPLICAVDAMFHPLEVRQHVRVTPALCTKPLPFVVVAGVATQEHQSVDGAGAAQHLAARPDDLSTAETGLRFGGVAPVYFGSGTTLPKPIGIWIHGLRSCPPASMAQSVMSGFSVRRADSTHPADPAPTTTTSNSVSNSNLLMTTICRDCRMER